jgi:hypothetical protein
MPLQNVALDCLQDSYLNAYVLLERVSNIDDLGSGALFEPRGSFEQQVCVLSENRPNICCEKHTTWSVGNLKIRELGIIGFFLDANKNTWDTFPP